MQAVYSVLSSRLVRQLRVLGRILFMLVVLGSAGASAEQVLLYAGETPTGEVLLEVHGLVTHTKGYNHARFDRAMFEALPRAELVTHTSVTDGPQHFSGFLLRDVLAYVGATGQTVVASALNGYVIGFAVAEFEQYDVVLADSQNGERLLPSDKGPFWLVYPRDQHSELQDIRYDYRWVWQLIRLDVE